MHTNATSSLMIGDSLEADILGARNAGIDQVFFNPYNAEHDHDVTYEISQLTELLSIV
jgi:putative hydrolase of the HAD superfamily